MNIKLISKVGIVAAMIVICLSAGSGIARADSVTYTFTGAGILAGDNFTYVSPGGYMTLPSGQLPVTTASDFYLCGFNTGLPITGWALNGPDALDAFLIFTGVNVPPSPPTGIDILSFSFGVNQSPAINMGQPITTTTLDLANAAGQPIMTIGTLSAVATPEPSMISMLLSGMLGLGLLAGLMRPRQSRLATEASRSNP
jgi:hypothetical protein